MSYSTSDNSESLFLQKIARFLPAGNRLSSRTGEDKARILMSAKDFAGASECSSRSWEECISETAHEFWSDPSDVFQIRRRDEEDEAALRQAALEKLSSSRSGIRDLENLVNLDRKIPIDRMLETREEENEGLLRHLRKRLDR